MEGFHGGGVRGSPPMHSVLEGVWRRFCLLLPHQEMHSNQEGGLRACEETGGVEDRRPRDEENNWLLEGRTVHIMKGGDRKDRRSSQQSLVGVDPSKNQENLR